MRKKQKMQYEMINGVLKLINDNTTKTDSLPKLKPKIDALKDIAEVLKLRSGTQPKAENDETDENGSAFDRLIKSTLAVSSALFLFAEEMNDEKLKAISNISQSSLRYYGMEPLYFRAEEIRKTAGPLLSKLTGFGLTSAKYNKFLSNLSELHSRIGQNSARLTAQKKVTGSVAQLIDQALIILKTIDKYMNVLAEDEQEFTEAYFNARIIKNYADTR